MRRYGYLKFGAVYRFSTQNRSSISVFKPEKTIFLFFGNKT